MTLRACCILAALFCLAIVLLAAKPWNGNGYEIRGKGGESLIVTRGTGLNPLLLHDVIINVHDAETKRLTLVVDRGDTLYVAVIAR